MEPEAAAALLDQKMEAECIASYTISDDRVEADGAKSCCAVRVYEKWFGLAGTTATLTITIENLSGVTRVKFTAGSGTRMPRGRMDWGSRDTFETMAKNILRSHRVME